MLRSIKKLHGYTIQATDGKIGGVHEFYFDDDRWTIRYLIVDTGTWLPGRHVLVSPSAIQDADWVIPKLAVNLTKGQIRESPEVDVYKPFSRQQELNYVKYYGWPNVVNHPKVAITQGIRYKRAHDNTSKSLPARAHPPGQTPEEEQSSQAAQEGSRAAKSLRRAL